MLASHSKISATIGTLTKDETRSPTLMASKSPFGIGIGNPSAEGQPTPAEKAEEGGGDLLHGLADPWGAGAKTLPTPMAASSAKPDFMALYMKQMETNQLLLNEV